MDPTMLAAIAAGQVAEYMNELEGERKLRRRLGGGRAPRQTRWERLRGWRPRARAARPEACPDQAATESC